MAASTKRSGKVNRRSEILRAAEMLMHSHGLSGVTTRQISQEVGCSEGALYFHFKGRLELLLAMLEEGLPDMLGPLQTLRESIGRGSPHANLAAALLGIFKFHRRVVSETAGLFAEPELLVAYRKSLARQGKGPHLSIGVFDYIAAEQEPGRIDSSVDAKLAACALRLCGCYQPDVLKVERSVVREVAPCCRWNVGEHFFRQRHSAGHSF